MFKRWLLADILMFAIAMSFAAQICVFNATMKQNAMGIVYGDNGLKGVLVFAEGDNGSGYAVTDNSGHYTMTTGLLTGTYNVTTYDTTGYIDGEVDSVSVTAGQTTPNVNLDLQLSGAISGKVTDAVNQSAIKGADIYAELSNGTLTFGSFGITGSDGSYLMDTNLPTGTYNVSISPYLAPVGYIGNMTTANVVAGVETKNVNIALARSGIISGNVAAPNGTGLFGIDVSAISSDYTYLGSATTDSAGNYRIATGLATDSYTVEASGDGNYTIYGGIMSPVTVSVTAGQETSGINIELTPVTTPPTPSGTITGRITDQSGNPIKDASVSATSALTGGLGSADTDSNGDYTISSGLVTGTDYNVSATASGYYDSYYPSLVTVTVGQTTSNINIQMTAEPAQNYGTITGTVTGAPNAIPEFQYPLMAMLSLTLVAAVVSRLMLKTKRYKNASSACV